MDHERAVRELAVEKYLLGDLIGDARNKFEEHLFECTQCAADLKSAVSMAEAMRTELATTTSYAVLRERKSSFLTRWFTPIWLAPTLAACLLLIVYQNTVRIPHLQAQLAQANTPDILSNLVLAGGTSRGGDVPHILASRNKPFLVSIDIPPFNGATGYSCTLYTSFGKEIWSVLVTPEQAKDTIHLLVPTDQTGPGEHTLTVRARNTGIPGNRTEIIAEMKFVLEFRT